MTHVLITGRVCGWDEDANLTYTVDTQKPGWRDSIIAAFRQDVWELDGNEEDLQEDEIFINGVFLSESPIVPLYEYTEASA